MSISYSENHIHWNYFLAIEKDFENISRYVEFAEANNSTFSIEFGRIIMAASQEIDGIMKKICNIIQADSNARNVDDYKNIIKQDLPELIQEEVFTIRFGMSSKPWINWKDDINPDFWKSNNKIKHDRTNHFEEANLKNAFNAVGALLIVTCYYYKLTIEKKENCEMTWKNTMQSLTPYTSLFTLEQDKYPGKIIVGEIQW
ncbi:hypothetical protein P2W68_16825 [Chryseobacterium arthrosphaerae]|uniref:hypothetical protein n=1 Tax=Chryseobacterium arthrosphaerae TaxID=651561 RepID=UPI0023E23A93|nr:hypothetical protein [Chryseobacterium arthrosphaerae]WES96498.1 hypothetical protein P2W68_16825 [Chryseobacterium arthrosphaerae]